MLKLYKEFKRRKMFRPLVAYAGFSFILLQVINIIFPALQLPPWTETFVVILVLYDLFWHLSHFQAFRLYR